MKTSGNDLSEKGIQKVSVRSFMMGAGLFIWILSFFWINSFEFNDLMLFEPNLSPHASHPFGTDALGRDYLIRVAMGAQISLFIGFVGASSILGVALIFGVLLSRTKFKNFFYRFLDIYESLPSFVLVSVLCLVFQKLFSEFSPLYQSMMTLILAVTCSHWMKSARILAERIQKLSAEVYMDGVRALGASPFYILRKHLIPGMREEILTLYLGLVPVPILYESFMSFVGLGIPSPWTSWGNLIEESWSSLSIYPHLIFFPGLFLFLTLFLLERVLRSKKS